MHDTRTYQAIREGLTTTFNVPDDEVTPEATMEQLGIDSLALAEFVLILSQRMKVRARSEDLARETTLAQLADYLDGLRATAAVR